MKRVATRRWLVVLLGVLSALALVLFGRWLNATKRGGQEPAEPFRIAGNFYYVGANDVAAFLITGPDGHIVLDGGYPTTASMIMASIAKLGFDTKDVKVLLNSEPHPDHAGGLGALQQASGAELWASEASADAIASGGDDPDMVLPLRALTTRYRRGDIVLVSFPFTDLTSSKRRPALVISPNAFNEHGEDLVLVAITSQEPEERAVAIGPGDCVDGTLPKPSYVKVAKILTMYSTLVAQADLRSPPGKARRGSSRAAWLLVLKPRGPVTIHQDDRKH